jgi:hypothetical protein
MGRNSQGLDPEEQRQKLPAAVLEEQLELGVARLLLDLRGMHLVLPYFCFLLSNYKHNNIY